jgi:hypothetical protein
MKKKLMCLVLALSMLLSCAFILTSCDDETVCTEHVDKNNDKQCDVCGEEIKEDGGDDECEHVDANDDLLCDDCGEEYDDGPEQQEFDNYADIDWEETKLIFQMTNNSDSEQNPSGCERYMAGEYAGADVDDIDDYIIERNVDAYLTTKVDVEYLYYQDVSAYDMSHVSEVIYNNIFSGSTKDNPDVYCNFNATMVGLSLKGCWANLKSETMGKNYLQFNYEGYDEDVEDLGYMYDYMENCTLSMEKMYVLASDYFMDLIRAFYVVPVNVKLLESVGMAITGDLDGDNQFTLDDFYQEVRNKDWDYNLVARYSEAIYEANKNNSTGGESIHDRLGWALSTGGMVGSGILYTTPITIINKTPNDDGTDYQYSYPQDSPRLYTLCDNLRTLMGKTGVLAVSTDYQEYGKIQEIAIRKRFCDDMILFGGIALLGSLEYSSYQTLKGSSGFGVVPVPFYYELTDEEKLDNDNHRYLTGIHNSGRSGAIAVTTPNFTQCTAFLDYQSTHSSDILNEYYDYKLQYQVVNGSDSQGTVEMLQYIRYNVRSNFDKTMEDAIQGYHNAYTDEWHVIIASGGYNVDIRDSYSELYSVKMTRLGNVLKKYPALPA